MSEKDLEMNSNNYDGILEEAQKEDSLKKEKSKKKKRVISIVAIVLAVAAILGITIGLKKKNKKQEEDFIELEQSLEDSMEVGIEDLGVIEESKDKEYNENIYDNVSNDINVEDLVEEDNKIYVDQEAVDKKDEVGKTEIDLKDDTLIIGEDGKIYEKEEGYEIQDESGNIIETGNNESKLEENYTKDEELDKIVENEDVNKFVELDTDYYDMNGELIYKKGEVILKETLEKLESNNSFTTEKPEIPVEEEKEELEESNKEQTSKEEVTEEPSKDQISKEEVTEEPSKDQISKEEVTEDVTKEPQIDSLGGVTNEDGTYTILGTTYMDQATFLAFVEDENSIENFIISEGVVYPIEVYNELKNQKSR